MNNRLRNWTSIASLLLASLLAAPVVAQQCTGCKNESLDATAPFSFPLGTVLTISFGGSDGSCAEDTWGYCVMQTSCKVSATMTVSNVAGDTTVLDYEGTDCSGAPIAGSGSSGKNSQPGTVLDIAMPLECGESCFYQLRISGTVWRQPVQLPDGSIYNPPPLPVGPIHSNIFLICSGCSDDECC